MATARKDFDQAAFNPGADLLPLVTGLELLALVGVEAGLLGPGAAVVEAMALAFPAQLLLAASSYFLEGISRPRRIASPTITSASRTIPMPSSANCSAASPLSLVTLGRIFRNSMSSRL